MTYSLAFSQPRLWSAVRDCSAPSDAGEVFPKTYRRHEHDVIARALRDYGRFLDSETRARVASGPHCEGPSPALPQEPIEQQSGGHRQIEALGSARHGNRYLLRRHGADGGRQPLAFRPEQDEGRPTIGTAKILP